MALLDTLIPKRDQQILAALMLHPDRTYAYNDLLRIGGSSRSAGAAVVDRFIRGGIAIDERVGNQRRVRLNSKWPLVEEVRSLCIKSFGVSEPIKNAIEPLLARISQAFLFGSVVKGTDHHESDIDLMIIGDVSMDELMVALEPAQRQLGRHIQFNLYSRNEWEKLASDRVVQSIVNGPKWIIYEQA